MGEPTRICPRCRPEQVLSAVDTPAGPTTDFCPACWGVFFDPGELHEFAGLEDGVDLLAEGKERGPGPACPGCQEGATEVEWPPGSELLIDVCPKGGVWLDGGEMGRLRALVSDKGEASWHSPDDSGQFVPVRTAPSEGIEKTSRLWIVYSAIIIFVAQVAVLGIVRIMTGLHLASDADVMSNRGQVALAGVVGFLVGGWISGRLSPGHTVLEPVIASIPTLFVFALVFGAGFTPLWMVLMLGVGVVLVMVAAVLGERMQP